MSRLVFSWPQKGGLYRLSAADTGQPHWQSLSFPAINVTATSVLVATRCGELPAILWGAQDGALYLSKDGGAGWQQLARPWQDESILNAAFSHATEPDAGLIVLTGRHDVEGYYRISVWQSVDGGVSWENLAGLATDIPAVLMALLGDGRQTAVVLTVQHRVVRLFVHPDTGEPSVEQFFFEEGTRITAIAAAAYDAMDRTLYAATQHGIFLSKDGGQSWSQLAKGPGERPVVGLLPVSTGDDRRKLFAVTLGGEVWLGAG